MIQLNLRDRDILRTKDKRLVPKVSFVQRFDCIWYVIKFPDKLQYGSLQNMKIMLQVYKYSITIVMCM